MTLVDFVVRCDADVRSGGDLIQVSRYAEALADLGTDVRIVHARDSMDLRRGAVVHFVNTARPYELLAGVAAARDHAIVISPIHHSLRDFRRMRRAESGQGLRSYLGRLPEPAREWLATGARRLASRADSPATVAKRAVLSLPQVPSVWARVGCVLNRAEAVTTLSSAEEALLKHDTGWNGLNAVRVPNGGPVSVAKELPGWDQRTATLICIGRVEPRKRQMEVARIAAARGIAVHFIGAPNESTPAYIHEFSEIVESSPHLMWSGGMENSDVCELLRQSRVLVNASWAEVQSLVDIEAISNGCRVFGTLTGSTYEHCPDATRVYGPDDLENLVLEASRSASEDVYDPDTVSSQYRHTWRDAAVKLHSVYERSCR